MGEFVYYSTKDEWWGLMEAVLETHNVRFAVDRAYAEPWADCHGKLTDELRDEIRPLPRVYLVGDSFSDDPLYLWRQDGGINAGKYFIDISRGGPAMDLSMPAQFEEGGLVWFAEGSLGFQKLYWNDALTQAYPASKPLKDAFGLIKRTLQRHLLERKVAKQKMWVSPKAWELFEAGKAAFPVSVKCFTVHGEVPPPTPWRYGATAPPEPP